MKIYKMVFSTLMLISTTSFAFDNYEYSAADEGEYYGKDDSYNYDSGEQAAPNDYYSQRYKKYSSRYSPQNQYVGGGKTFIFDPRNLRWYAYYNGNLINSGRASGGKHYCPDIGRPCRTPVGVFRIGHKGGPECKSSKYPIGRGNAPMPWCAFFKGGFAIHGSWAVPGYNASHGCIRVPPSDARWLNQAFLNPGTKVIVRSY